MRSLLLEENFDFRQSNQYILVRAIGSCFRFAKMYLCQVSLLSRQSCTLFIWKGKNKISINHFDFVGLNPKKAGLEPISYRGALLNPLLHATVYMFLQNLLNVLVQLANKM
jgi:hypothetical protein